MQNIKILVLFMTFLWATSVSSEPEIRREVLPLFQRIAELIESNNLDTATTQLRELENHPVHSPLTAWEMANIFYDYAWIDEKRGDLERAIANYYGLLEQTDVPLQTQFQITKRIADHYASLKQYEKFVAVYEPFLDRLQGHGVIVDSSSFGRLADTFTALKKWRKAVFYYKKAIAYDESEGNEIDESWLSAVETFEQRIELDARRNWRDWVSNTLPHRERQIARITGAMQVMGVCHKDKRNKGKLLFTGREFDDVMTILKGELSSLIESSGLTQSQTESLMSTATKNEDLQENLRLYMVMDYGDALEFYCYRIRDAVKTRDYEAMDWG